MINKLTPEVGEVDINILTIADNGSKVVFEIKGSTHNRTYLSDLKGNISTIIANNDTAIEYETSSIWTETSDGGSILSYFSHTKGELFKQAALIVEIHGGPHSREKLSLEAFSQEFLASGYNVLRVNYRNSSGFGKKLLKPNMAGYQRQVVLDIIESLKSTLAKKQLSPNKIIAFGGSFGGLLVTDIATSDDLHQKFSTFISLNGLHDYCQWSERPEIWSNGKWADCSNKAVKTYFSQRKISHNKPFLIVYGTDDEIVLPKQSEELLSKFSNFKNVTGLKLQGEQHNVSLKHVAKMLSGL
jgi:dipeptidyl aminopeptidase/acylaminoacyl peptidase